MGIMGKVWEALNDIARKHGLPFILGTLIAVLAQACLAPRAISVPPNECHDELHQLQLEDSRSSFNVCSSKEHTGYVMSSSLRIVGLLCLCPGHRPIHLRREDDDWWR